MQAGGARTSSKSEVDVAEWVGRLMQHPLYEALRDEPRLHIFMRSHVFVVWDFQSLLKALQREVTCVQVPWLPTTDPEARRFVKEIVLDEESDEAPGGGFVSHFELYLQAMQDCGADTRPIRGFLGDLRQGRPVGEALARPDVPLGVASFVRHTMAVAASCQPHRIAAAFAYGREEVIPAMFRRLVDRLADIAPQRWSTFRSYLERHIGQDAERHGPRSKALVARRCGTNATLWAEAEDTARGALESRLGLWDDILQLVLADPRRQGGDSN